MSLAFRGCFRSKFGLPLTVSLLLTLPFILIACAAGPEAKGAPSVAIGQAPLTVTFINNSANADEFLWDFGDGTSSTTRAQEETISHEYTKSGTYSVTLTALKKEAPKERDTITFTVTVEAGPLDHVILEPSSPAMEVTQGLQFTATALDQFDNEIQGLTFEWSASAGGIIEPTGTFTAGIAVGPFPDAVQVRVTQGAIQAGTTATVNVSPGALDHIVLGPHSVELDIGEDQSFVAKAFDQFDNEIQGLTFEWQVIGGVGTVGPSGRFSAGTKAGTFPTALQVKGSLNQVAKSTASEVTIRPDPLRAIELVPKVATVEIQGQQQFTATPLDQFGNEIPQLVFTWNTEAPGEVDSAGRFTAGTRAGTYSDGVIVEVTEGTTTRRAKAEVTVTPGPLSRVVVDPSAVTLDIGTVQQFSFTALDEFGNKVPGTTASWSVTPDNGTIDSSGLLTTGTQAGEFPGALLLRVNEGAVTVTALADLFVQPDPLFSVEIEPATAVVRSGATRRFSATGFDFFGNPIPGLNFTWEGTGGVVEKIDSRTARFHGGAQGGLYEAKATAQSENSTRTGTAIVGIPPGWMPAGKPNMPRQEHAAVLLDDGMVLIVGGTSRTAELYDPATRSFTLLGDVPFGQGVGATKLEDGSVLVVGEWPPGTTAMIYDPATRRFRPIGSVNIARTYLSMTLLSDGKVLLAGGQQSGPNGAQTVATAEVYDPLTETFSLSGSLNQHRSLHDAVLLPNGKVLIAGGREATASRGQSLYIIELFDPVVGDFSVVGKTAFVGSSAVLLKDGTVLLAAGAPGGRPAEIFDPTTNTFSPTEDMLTKHDLHTVTLLRDGRVLVAGGERISEVELYDPLTRTWRSTLALPEPRRLHTATLLPSGEVLIIGGQSDSEGGIRRLDSALVYVP